MEFRCRLGTPGGEILEGVYVADSEDRLRRELEEKGLYVLSLQRRTGLQTALQVGGGRRGRVSRQEFLVFNQELATLLKAGMRLEGPPILYCATELRIDHSRYMPATFALP